MILLSALPFLQPQSERTIVVRRKIGFARKRKRAGATRPSLAYIEDRRLKILEAVFNRVETRDRLRRLSEQITGELKDTQSPRASEFITWLSGLLERAEQAANVNGLERLFEAEHVFGPDDDKGFYPSPYGW